MSGRASENEARKKQRRDGRSLLTTRDPASISTSVGIVPAATRVGGHVTKEEPAAGRRALRITDQFRKSQAMVYDLRCGDDRLTLTIAARASAADEGDWRVEAWPGRGHLANAVSAWGVSPADALRAVGASWTQHRLAKNLPPFDWDAVAKALREVHAI